VLLAKSKQPEVTVRGRTLYGHTLEVILAARHLLLHTTYGKDLYRAMHLNRFVTFKEWIKLCFVSVLCHDLGKANETFQATITAADQGNRQWQAFRHELISGYLLCTPEMQAWGKRVVGGSHWPLIVGAVIGHHLKAVLPRLLNDDFAGSGPWGIYGGAAMNELRPLCAEVEVDSFPNLTDTVLSYDDLETFWMDLLDGDQPDTALSRSLKYLVVLADTFGSMAPKEGQFTDLDEYRLRLFSDIELALHPRYIDYESRARSKMPVGAVPFPFQEEAQRHKGDIIIDVGCGQGKTTGALLWASNEPSRPTVFTTPTMGATTGLFLDYRQEGDTNRHSRTEVDSVLQMEQGEMTIVEEAEVIQAFNDLVAGTVYSTVDQVLGCIGYNRKSILWLLRLARSQIIFDEYHDYDARLVQMYREFLVNFPDVPVCTMTATLPKHRVDIIKKSRPEPFFIHDNRMDSPARVPKYKFQLVDNASEAAKHFGPQCLWFLNTRKLVHQAAQDFPNSITYHSGFKYSDRRRIQDLLMGHFEKDQLQAIVTQICETSTDISAWNMLSTYAPPSALIQRMGRLVRRLQDIRGHTGNIYLYMPPDGTPYILSPHWKKYFERWRKWVRQFEGKVVSQEDLARAYRSLPSYEQKVPVEFNLYQTHRQSLRIQSANAVTGILEDDYRDLLALEGVAKLESDSEKQAALWKGVRVQLQLVDIPLYLKARHSKMIHQTYRGRVVLPRGVFHYSPKTGLHYD
jgi:CRISPR-associated endonuclease/helicase Cas3